MVHEHAEFILKRVVRLEWKLSVSVMRQNIFQREKLGSAEVEGEGSMIECLLLPSSLRSA